MVAEGVEVEGVGVVDGEVVGVEVVAAAEVDPQGDG